MNEDQSAHWVVTNITYQQAVNLAASDLIKDFQRDPVKGTARFWPGSKGVFKHLMDHAPEASLILNDRGEPVRLERKTQAIKSFPVRKPVKMGMSISD